MRKLINIWFLLPALLLVWAVSATATTKQVTLSYNTSDFTYSTEGGVTSIVPSDLMAVYGTDTLAPALPRYGVSILIAPTQTYDTVTVTQSQTLVQSGVYIGPNTLPVPNDGTPPPSSPSLVNYAASEYPASGSEVVYTGCHDIDGYRVLTFSVSPFRYDATNGDLYLRTALTLNISLSGQQQAPAIGGVPQPHHGGANMREAVSNIITNMADLEQIYPSSAVTNPLENPNFRYEYLIVTVDSLKNNFEPLSHWKTMKGVKTKIITLEDIRRDYPLWLIQQNVNDGGYDSLEMQIKYAIKDYYNGSYCGLKYVLLGGDIDIVPSLKCALEIAGSTNYTDTPCDMFYACLDNMSWDTNNGIGNHIYGQKSDIFDFIPDIAVSRLSAVNKADVSNYVNRLIEYETCPNENFWNDTILLCGAKHFGYKNAYGELLSESHTKLIQLYGAELLSSWNGGVTSLFDTGNSLNYTDFTPSTLQFELHKGYPFVIEDSHGNYYNYCLKSTVSDTIVDVGIANNSYLVNEGLVQITNPQNYKYSTSFAENANNKFYTIIVSNACETNYFDHKFADYGRCLSEQFLSSPNSGVLGYYGSCRSGFAAVGKMVPGESNQYSFQFLKRLFLSKKHRFGEAVNNSKVDVISNVNFNSYNEYRYLYLALNPLGDPEMPIFISRPQRLINTHATLNNGSLFLSTSIDSCDVCVMSLSDYGDTYYKVLKDTSNVVINNVPVHCSLCVTKTGYIPIVFELTGDGVYENPLYLQNETLSGHNTFYTDKAFVGSNVTTIKPNGPVTIDSGSVVINAKDGVQITNDFKVNKCAEFKIETRK